MKSDFLGQTNGSNVFQSTSLINQRWNHMVEISNSDISFNPHLWLIRDEILLNGFSRRFIRFQSTSLINQRWNSNFSISGSGCVVSFNPHLWLIRDEISIWFYQFYFPERFNPHLWLIRDEMILIRPLRVQSLFQSTSLINQRWNRLKPGKKSNHLQVSIHISD